MARRSNGTRERTLQAAIKLFAEYGYEGVSTREITKLGEVNLAAIHYHFGGKKELYIAAFESYFDRITEERYGMLAAIEEAAGDNPPALKAVLRALIKPHINVMKYKGGVDYLRMYGLFNQTPLEVIEEVYRERILPVRRRFIEAIMRSEPRLSEKQVHRVFSLISVTMVGAIFDRGYELLSGSPAIPKDIDAFVDMLVDYSTAGVRAIVEGVE